jgi:hypothetical protein
VSEDVAHELRRRCDLQMRDIPLPLQDFTDRYEGRYRDIQLPLPMRLVWTMLTDQQIAVLRDIGPTSSFNEEKKAVVLEMLARGYLEREGDMFRLTAMGLKELLDRRRPT